MPRVSNFMKYKVGDVVYNPKCDPEYILIYNITSEEEYLFSDLDRYYYDSVGPALMYQKGDRIVAKIALELLGALNIYNKDDA